jgi:hypothetical protein
LPEVFTVESANQINIVTTTVAAGKAIPEVLAEADHKGVWIITTMDGTWTNKPVSPLCECRQQSFVIKDCGYADCFLERVEL